MIILLFGSCRITSGLLCDSALMAFALHYCKVLSTLQFHPVNDVSLVL